MSDRIILKWREENPQGRLRWFLRGVRPDGTFYGELQTEGKSGTITGIEGTLAKEDASRLLKLVDQLQIHAIREGTNECNEAWRGLLATGLPQKPTILLRYHDGDEGKWKAAKLFLEVVDVLRPYMAANQRYR